MHRTLRAALDVATAAPLFWLAPFIRPWHLRWGATDDEVRGAMPGDDLLRGTRFRATRAIDIDAAPDAVWPWLVQIGFRRAGFYSYDLLDNLGQPSAERIVPEFQDLEIGDRIVMAEPVTDATAFRLVDVEPGRSMVWHKPDSTWSWRLSPTPDGRTRLVTRLKARYDLQHPGGALLSIALLEFADFPMMRRLLLGVKARAEGTVPAPTGDADGEDGAEASGDRRLAHWKDAAARRAYALAYDESLRLWPIPCESRFVETRFGTTHVVVSGDPAGEPLVLIHAASLSATQWHLQAADLGRHHRLYAIDIMGDIGRSSQTRAIHTRTDAADWLTGVLDGLGIEQAAFVGSSFGGWHATNLAVHRPGRVRSLVLLAPAATVKPFRPFAYAVIRMGSLIPLPMSVRPGLRGMMGGALPDERIVRQMEIGVAGYRYDRQGVFPGEFDDVDLGRIACPTLLLVGDQEMIYDPAAAVERARQRIPQCEARIIPGVGHLLGMQRPDLVNDLILDFLGAPAAVPA